jgi:hypothetical protein
VRGFFFVRDGNKTRGFGSGLGFALMGADATTFFSLWVYPNLIRLFSTFFYKSDGHPKSDGCGCNFSSDSISSVVGDFGPADPNPSHCHP